jgi:uncharacterized RDD family membrane protein YckC
VNVLPDDAPRPRQPSDFPPSGPNSLAPFWPRALARTLDVVIIAVPALLIMVLVTVDRSGGSTAAPSWIFLPFVGMFGLYETLMVAWVGQTLGKMATGVRVAQLVNGRRPDLGQSALRAVVPLVVFALPILILAWPLVYVVAVFNPLGRGIPDQAGGTVVVRSR